MASHMVEADMLVTVTDNQVLVRLSRRNLRQLHDILEGNDVRHTYLARKDESGKALVVQIEEDADHYERRDPGPGLGRAV
jgi:hypothetical protein